MTASQSLSPSFIQLLALQFNPLVWIPILAAAGLYFVGFLRSKASGDWPAWKAVVFAIGVLLLIVATQTAAKDLTLNSMALYMARLMLLAEVIPPLLVLGLPRGILFHPKSMLGRILSVLLDPWVALALWSAVVIFWNIPAGFNASMVTNTSVALLPWLYLFSGLLIWCVILRPFPSVQSVTIGSRGWFGLLAALPMMAVSAVWLYSKHILYAAYVGALCLWNLTPLQNQQISGAIMMIAGLPGLGLALVQLMAWLIQLADSDARNSE